MTSAAETLNKYTGLIQLLILIAGFVFIAAYNQQTAPLERRIDSNSARIDQLEEEIDAKADKTLYTETILQLRSDISEIKADIKEIKKQ